MEIIDDTNTGFDELTPGATAGGCAAPPVTPEEAERFTRALAYLREHFRTATLKDVAHHVGLSPFYFHRRFALWAGRTPKAIMVELQIEHAKTLLLAGVRLPDVARACGFAHQSHLTHRFKLSCAGDTPGRWLKKQPRSARPPVPLDAEPAQARAAA